MAHCGRWHLARSSVLSIALPIVRLGVVTVPLFQHPFLMLARFQCHRCLGRETCTGLAVHSFASIAHVIPAGIRLFGPTRASSMSVALGSRGHFTTTAYETAVQKHRHRSLCAASLIQSFAGVHLIFSTSLVHRATPRNAFRLRSVICSLRDFHRGLGSSGVSGFTLGRHSTPAALLVPPPPFW
jgi:hypothetical protein